jgi:hypothetical protein
MSLAPLLDSLRILPDGWHERPVGRRVATETDPLLFAYVYLRHHLRSEETGDEVSFSDVHIEWAEQAKQWMTPGRSRDIYVAPRSMGKTTWWYLVLPCWAAAHGYVKFAAAFSDSGTQSELHLQTFKHELETNAALRQDFPDLCTPTRRPRGITLADNKGMLHTKSGFVFAARGIDSGTLGMKVGEKRPDLLILDDVEPGESNYSAYQVTKRLSTVTDVVLPLNDGARVVMIGTTTMTGSIIHQAVQHVVEPADWIRDERFTVHHAEPFDDAGDSIWPERWSTEYLRGIEHTASFAKNFRNQPRVLDGEYWLPTDYVYGALTTASRRILVVDVAVTTARTSDETALAVVSYSAHTRSACVDHVQGVRLKGEPLRELCLRILSQYPDIAYVVWERNQGGTMLPTSVLHDFPVEVRTVHNTEPKPVRIERALSYYRRGVVTHARSFPQLEAQQQEYPHGLHDDQADAVSIALDHFAIPETAQRTTLHRAVR